MADYASLIRPTHCAGLDIAQVGGKAPVLKSGTRAEKTKVAGLIFAQLTDDSSPTVPILHIISNLLCDF